MTSGLKLILQPCTNPEGGGGWGLELCLPDLTVCRTTWEADMGGKTIFCFLQCFIRLQVFSLCSQV
jgi:hypothetical protein